MQAKIRQKMTNATQHAHLYYRSSNNKPKFFEMAMFGNYGGGKGSKNSKGGRAGSIDTRHGGRWLIFPSLSVVKAGVVLKGVNFFHGSLINSKFC